MLTLYSAAADVLAPGVGEHATPEPRDGATASKKPCAAPSTPIRPLAAPGTTAAEEVEAPGDGSDSRRPRRRHTADGGAESTQPCLMPEARRATPSWLTHHDRTHVANIFGPTRYALSLTSRCLHRGSALDIKRTCSSSVIVGAMGRRVTLAPHGLTCARRHDAAYRANRIRSCLRTGRVLPRVILGFLAFYEFHEI